MLEAIQDCHATVTRIKTAYRSLETLYDDEEARAKSRLYTRAWLRSLKQDYEEERTLSAEALKWKFAQRRQFLEARKQGDLAPWLFKLRKFTDRYLLFVPVSDIICID